MELLNNVLEKLIHSLLLDMRTGIDTGQYDISGAGHISRYDLELFEKTLIHKAQKNGYSVTVFYPKKVNRLKASADEKVVCRIVKMPDDYHVAIAMAKRD